MEPIKKLDLPGVGTVSYIDEANRPKALEIVEGCAQDGSFAGERIRCLCVAGCSANGECPIHGDGGHLISREELFARLEESYANDARRDLIQQLLFAASDLVRHMLSVEGGEFHCAGCGGRAEIGALMQHDPKCPVAHVRALIDTVILDSFPKHKPQRREQSATNAKSGAIAGNRSRSAFGEPWLVVPGDAAHFGHELLVDSAGFVRAEVFGPYMTSRGVATRIAACVNFCTDEQTIDLQLKSSKRITG
jgi:hypothetical protein